MEMHRDQRHADAPLISGGECAVYAEVYPWTSSESLGDYSSDGGACLQDRGLIDGQARTLFPTTPIDGHPCIAN